MSPRRTAEHVSQAHASTSTYVSVTGHECWLGLACAGTDTACAHRLLGALRLLLSAQRWPLLVLALTFIGPSTR